MLQLSSLMDNDYQITSLTRKILYLFIFSHQGTQKRKKEKKIETFSKKSPH